MKIFPVNTVYCTVLRVPPFCLQVGVVREPSSGTAPAVIAIVVILVIILLVGGVVAAIVLAVVIKKRKDKSLR